MCHQLLIRILLIVVCGTIVAPRQSLCQQMTLNVEFELHAPGLAKDTAVFITGSVAALGNWNPETIRMTPSSDHKWTFKIQSKAGLPIEYKYTLGTWSREGANADGSPLQNLVLEPTADTTVSDTVKFWTTEKQQKISGQVTGTVRYHRQMEFEGLLPRDVIVWLPPDYDTSSDRYPVLYMHDGQNIVDPKTSSFGVDWQVDETLTRMIGDRTCPPIIVVGIYNTAERAADYLPGEQGDRYANFVCTKLKPFVDGNYRTNSSRAGTAIGGSSAGGICAFRIAWENPEIFSKAICMSPAFKYERSDGSYQVSYIERFSNSDKPDPLPVFYIDNGGLGLEKILQPGIDAMLIEFKAKGMEAGKHFFWKLFPDAQHNESAWSRRMPTALKLLFGD